MGFPKRLQKTLDKMATGGDPPVLVVPALLQRYSTERQMAMARLGMEDTRVESWLVATGKNIHFVRSGILWDKVQSIPLHTLTGVDYVDEFHNNALKLRVGEAAEKVIFYDDLDGVKFYRLMKDVLKDR
ncbi:MAG: hypothetical protein GKC10_08630 [Methanosarcinales archaeon]|nr:hypothetical protein [Methanosarcinales archaeon]